MTGPFGISFLPARFVLVLVFTCALVLGAVPVLDRAPAAAADPRLEKAQERKAEIQERLDALTTEIEETRAEVEDTRNELDRLREKESEHNDEASSSAEERVDRLRESYKRGHADPMLQLLTAEDETDVIEQARFMAWLAAESQKDVEAATADAVRADALADHTAELMARLEEREEELADQQDEVEDLLDEAIQAEKDVKALIEKEEAEAAAAARAAAAAASTSSASSNSSPAAPAAPAAPVSGGVACPVGTPRSYIDSWGAPRSGGRSHKGTDILAPRGTPTPAYESGVISRLSSNSLGGISLYLRGDSGNLYYYTHLSGYAGVGVGQRVSAGQTVAYVGATGNARGINHLHFEVRPGGGGQVNPYPYVRRACG